MRKKPILTGAVHPNFVRQLTVSLGVAAACGLVVLMALFSMGAVHAQAPVNLTYGAEIEGNVTSLRGEEWTFQGCQGDVVSVTMTSADFSSFLELYPPTGRRSLAEAEDTGDGAILDAVTLPESGTYTLIAAGERSSDRGVYQLSLALADGDETAQGALDGMIAPGDLVESRIRNRFGESWGFHGCAGDTVTASMESGDFDTYLELYGPSSRRPLAEDDNGGGGTNSEIANFELPESGLYTLLAAGANRADLGAYTLSMDVETGEGIAPSGATATPTRTLTRRGTATRTPTRGSVTPTPSRTPTRRATATRTPSRTPTPATGCIVKTNNLNLRSGPGTNYIPAIASLAFNTRLIPLARNSDSSWVNVEVANTGQTGWVSSGSQFVECSVTIGTLPLGTIPPTPTPTVTPTKAVPVAAIPTPPFALSPGQGSGGEGNAVGGIFAVPSFITGFNNNGQPIFSQRLSFRMMAKIDGRDHDGDGIQRVEVSITNQNGDEVYARTENSPGYCAFGGNDTPDDPCIILELTTATNWPDTNNRIQDGRHQIQFNVLSEDGLEQNWRVNFEIQRQSVPAPGGGTGSGTGGTTSIVLFDGSPAQSSSFCSSFRSDCGFNGCGSGQRLVYGPFCRNGDYDYIQPGLYEIAIQGSGFVKMGATDFGTFQERFALAESQQTLPASFRFCWPGRASNGFGFETIVESTGGNPRADRIRVTYLGSNCQQ